MVSKGSLLIHPLSILVSHASFILFSCSKLKIPTDLSIFTHHISYKYNTMIIKTSYSHLSYIHKNFLKVSGHSDTSFITIDTPWFSHILSRFHPQVKNLYISSLITSFSRFTHSINTASNLILIVIITTAKLDILSCISGTFWEEVWFGVIQLYYSYYDGHDIQTYRVELLYWHIWYFTIIMDLVIVDELCQ